MSQLGLLPHKVHKAHHSLRGGPVKRLLWSNVFALGPAVIKQQN